MENTIKQSEAERERGLDTLRRLHDEYKPLKREVDKMRGSLGLDKIANLDEENSLAEWVGCHLVEDKLISSFKHMTPKSDQHLHVISPYNVPPESSIKVMGINEIIGN